MKVIDVIAGARPNFVKIASVVKAINSRRIARVRLIHTGQHYDKELSESFFTELEIPEPDFNLGVGSGTPADQTAKIMVGYEKILADSRSELCIVVGDVNSTMACAITAQKMNVPVAHVESGLRSGDWSMPEEINRLVTDSISNLHFTTSKYATDNLIESGVARRNIFFVGNTMIDTLRANLGKLQRPEIWETHHLKARKYFVLTLHRPSNVDDIENLTYLLEVLSRHADPYPIIFPVHPRTRARLDDSAFAWKHLIPVPSLPYLQFNYLVKNSAAIVTDSGGITEEATVLQVPCITLRSNTERPETISFGTNELVGNDASLIERAFEKLFAGSWKKGTIPPLWDGKASLRIAAILDQYLGNLK